MENASKALIIAGSILVSIVIITLGVMIVNNVRSTINDNSNMSAQEVASYNSKFEAYEGVKSGTQVRALLETVRSHNNIQTDESKYIYTDKSSVVGSYTDAESIVNNSDTAKQSPGTMLSSIKAGYTYDVKCIYDTKSGLVIAIAIDKQ